MNKQEYPEYITKQDILKFIDISVSACANPYNACEMISNKIKKEFDKSSEIKLVNGNYVVVVDAENIEFETKNLYVVPNINDNKLEKKTNSTVIQSKSI